MIAKVMEIGRNFKGRRLLISKKSVVILTLLALVSVTQAFVRCNSLHKFTMLVVVTFLDSIFLKIALYTVIIGCYGCVSYFNIIQHYNSDHLNEVLALYTNYVKLMNKVKVNC